jgi:hypothetical protein
VPKKTKKRAVRREYTKAHEKELRMHSRAKTPLPKIAKLTKRTIGSLRQKAMRMDQAWPSPVSSLNVQPPIPSSHTRHYWHAEKIADAPFSSTGTMTALPQEPT